MNIIHIAGHLGADPEVRYTPSGQKVTTFRVAVNIRKSGKEETIWYRITIWGDRFDKLIPYLKKGSSIIVIGTLQKPEIYTDKEGRQHVSLEITAEMIQFSPFGRTDRSENQTEGGYRQNYSNQSMPQRTAPVHSGGEADYGSPAGAYDGYRFDQVGSNQSAEDDNIPF